MSTRERIERRLWAGGDGLDGSGRRDRPPRPRRRLAVGALGVVALLVALLALQQLGGGDEGKSGDGKRGTRTATVARRTLVERESIEGTLGYAGARAVVNRLATGDGSGGGGSGTGGNPAGGSSGAGASSGGGGSGEGSASRAGSSTGSASSAGSGSSSGSPSGQSASLGGHRASGDRRSSTGAWASLTSQASGRHAAGDDRGAADGKGNGDGNGKGGKRGDRDEGRAGDRKGGRGRRGAGGDGSESGRGSAGAAGSKASGAAGGGGRGAPTAGDGSNGGGGSGRGGSAGAGASQGSGTVTRLAREGSIVDRGETLYELDNRPVLLMYGSVPAYRELSTATTDGPDVRQLEQNLVALGFGAGVTVDEDFSAATSAAVKRWQRSLGLPQTGEIELGRVVFLPGARRVGSHKAKVGSVLGTGAEVLETTSIRRVVTVELDVAKQSLVRRGDKVTVTLPDGTTVSGRIARVGRVARKQDDGAGGGGDGGVPDGGSGSEGGELVIDLSIVLSSRRGVSRLDQAPVTVGIAQETRRNALAVPVTALVARPGGGYGVEVVRGGRRRIVAVETGLFASGRVEISGRGIRAGTKVAIPAEA